MEIKKVVSFSGGRTSAYLCHLMIELYGVENITFLYLDTGAEHPKTYEFIRKVNKHFNLNLVCLRPIVRNGRKSSDYKIVPIEEIGCDMLPITQVMQKYGKPSFNAASCTREMKRTLADKWRSDTFGKKGSEMWLGIRSDEPSRLVGNACYRKLSVLGFSAEDVVHMLRDWVAGGALKLVKSFPDGDKFKEAFLSLTDYLLKRGESDNLHYLAEISDSEKQDVIDYWLDMPFDLEIKEHLGNCVFCVKKSVNKLALAMRDEPVLYSEWKAALGQANLREDLPKIHGLQKAGIVYRGNNSLDSIEAKFAHLTRDEIAATIRSMKPLAVAEDGGRSESCEAF